MTGLGVSSRTDAIRIGAVLPKTRRFARHLNYENASDYD